MCFLTVQWFIWPFSFFLFHHVNSVMIRSELMGGACDNMDSLARSSRTHYWAYSFFPLQIEINYSCTNDSVLPDSISIIHEAEGRIKFRAVYRDSIPCVFYVHIYGLIRFLIWINGNIYTRWYTFCYHKPEIKLRVCFSKYEMISVDIGNFWLFLYSSQIPNILCVFVPSSMSDSETVSCDRSVWHIWFWVRLSDCWERVLNYILEMIDLFLDPPILTKLCHDAFRKLWVTLETQWQL